MTVFSSFLIKSVSPSSLWTTFYAGSPPTSVSKNTIGAPSSTIRFPLWQLSTLFLFSPLSLLLTTVSNFSVSSASPSSSVLRNSYVIPKISNSSNPSSKNLITLLSSSHSPVSPMSPSPASSLSMSSPQSISTLTSTPCIG